MTASKVTAQTDRHTHRHDENITSTTYAGGNNVLLRSIWYQNLKSIHHFKGREIDKSPLTPVDILGRSPHFEVEILTHASDRT